MLLLIIGFDHMSGLSIMVCEFGYTLFSRIWVFFIAAHQKRYKKHKCSWNLGAQNLGADVMVVQWMPGNACKIIGGAWSKKEKRKKCK
jgi:hypothetical protein